MTAGRGWSGPINPQNSLTGALLMYNRAVQVDFTPEMKEVCHRLRDLAPAPGGGITQPRTTFFDHLSMLFERYDNYREV